MSKGIPIQREDGVVVGHVIGEELVKEVRGSEHFLTAPPAIANDLVVITRARQAGASICSVFDKETGITYRARFDTIMKKGEVMDRGHGAQVRLYINYWSKDDPRQMRFA